MYDVKVSLFRRKGRKVFYMQYRDPDTGAKVVKSTEKTRQRDAERAAANWEREVREGRDERNGRILWEAFRSRYENEKLSTLAEKTDQKVTGVLNVLERTVPVRRLADLTSAKLSKFQEALRNMGRSESTIKGHLAHIRAMLSWAVEVDLLRQVPKVPKVQRAKGSKIMKGRPITTEEYERMLAKVGEVLGQRHVPSWTYLLDGLWLSGLRSGEAVRLSWDSEAALSVDLSGRHPRLRVRADGQKSNRDELLPMVPEFAELLLKTPEDERHGYVFNPSPRRPSVGRLSKLQVEKVIGQIGAAAGVVVERKADRVKYATAHDLRRTFGTRWARRVMPAVLQRLMRHASVQTSMQYYVDIQADDIAADLWKSHVRPVGDTLGDTRPEDAEIKSDVSSESLDSETA